MDASGWIDLVIARAAELRKAGITAIGFDGCTASLEPAPPEFPADPPGRRDEEQFVSTLHDPASYPDGVVPGYVIQRYDRNIEEG
jgi:hypothetical protein